MTKARKNNIVFHKCYSGCKYITTNKGNYKKTSRVNQPYDIK